MPKSVRKAGIILVFSPNVGDQRLATLDFPSGPILSRVRCIAWFRVLVRWIRRMGIRNDLQLLFIRNRQLFLEETFGLIVLDNSER